MANSLQSSQIGAPAIQRGAWLDALRFIVACLMVVHHFQKAGPIPLETLHPVFDRGYLLTNFFLIDSGYVLARIYGAQVAAGRMGLGAFFSKRLLRLLPAHLLMSTALIGLVLIASAAGVTPRNPEWFDWSQLPAQFFLVQSYGVPGGIGWNAPTWSISALIGCYLAFPSLLRGARRLRGVEALMAIVAVYLVANLLAHGLLGYPVYQMPLKHGFLRALPLFVCGVLLARASETISVSPRVAAALLASATAALALLQWAGPNSLASLALIATIIFAAAAIPVAKPSKLVEKAALASFAIFITNEVVRIAWMGVANVVAARLGLGEAAQWAFWAVGMTGAVGFGLVFYAAVDAPSQAWIKAARLPSMAKARTWLSAQLPQPRLTELGVFDRPVRYAEIPVDKGSIRNV